MPVRFCDEFESGFGWILDEFLLRSSHALVVDGKVWVLDPVDAAGVEERILAAGTPAGVIQLLDRHRRDCEPLAERLGVPHHVVPAAIAGTPFEFRTVRRNRIWNEVVLWWPEGRVLACADVLGTARGFRAGGEPIALHPLLRVGPPRRALAGLDPLHVLCGHGEGLHGDGAATAVDEALATARRRLPQAWWQGFRAVAGRRRRRRRPD